MALYKIPGVYFQETTQSLGSTASGYNRTAIIGQGQLYTTIKNLELIKSKVITPKTQIILENIAPTLDGYTPVVGNYTLWTDSVAPAEGKIQISLVKAHWIGNGTISVGDYVVLENTDTTYGYKLALEGDEGALEVIENIEGNGFASSTEGTEGALQIISTPTNTDNIKLPEGTNANAGDILEVVGLGNISGFYNYTLGIDYTIDANNTTITWISTNRPVSGSTFYITYKLNKSAEKGDFKPVLLFNQTAIEQVYGPEYLNGVIQPLTLAANLVLEGQTLLGGGVYCVQVPDDTDASYKAAIDSLNNLNVQTIIILKQDSIALRNYLIQNIETCSSSLYGKERTTFIIPNSDTLSTDTIVAQREGLMNDRVTYFANKKVTITLTDAETQEEKDMEVSAIYALCALSGIEGNPEYGYSEPMLRKTLPARITLSGEQRFDPSERNYLCSNFLSMLDFNENTNLTQVFDIFTTNSTSVITETRQVRRVTDLIRTDLRKQLAIYIGKKNTPATASSAKVKTESILGNYVSVEEIKDFRNVTANYNANNPKQLDISFTYLPLFEVKWVAVSISINID